MSEVPCSNHKPLCCSQSLVRRVLPYFACFLTLISLPLSAQEQDWWFDVEVIIFKRDVSINELSEKFVDSPIDTKKRKSLDLLSPYLQPDLSFMLADLDFCRASNRLKVQQQYEQDFAFPESTELPTVDNTDESEQPANDFATETSQNADTQVHSEDNFEYQVVSSDIFKSADNESVGSDSEYTNTPSAATQSPPSLDNPAIEDRTVALENAQQIANEYVAQDISINWLEWQIPQHLPCVYAEQKVHLPNPFEPAVNESSTLAKLDVVPVKINGIEWQNKRQAFLLPQKSLQLNSLYKDINKQRDIQPILHLGWRQQVKFGQDKAQAFRLFAGKNFGKDFTLDGRVKPSAESLAADEPYMPIEEQVSIGDDELSHSQSLIDRADNAALFTKINALLNDDSPLDLSTLHTTAVIENSPQTSQQPSNIKSNEIWQLDGNFKVFLKYVGRTPYLHIESDLDFRQAVFDPALASVIAQQQNSNTRSANTVLMGGPEQEPNTLQSVNVKQFKQVISKQLHYFDHPLFGMLVNITRYRWPQEANETEFNE